MPDGRAPWTDEQVEALNAYQRDGWFHPFTCGRCRDADPNFPLQDEHLLVATNAGWTCPTCDYTQNWAHEFMFNGPPERQIAEGLGADIVEDVEDAVDRGAIPISPHAVFSECPMCWGAMVQEHAHYRCSQCGWRDSCCD